MSSQRTCNRRLALAGRPQRSGTGVGGAPLLCPRLWVRVKPDMVASERGQLPACGSLRGSQVLEGSRHWTGRVQAHQRPSRRADPGSGQPATTPRPSRPGLPKAAPPDGCFMDDAGPASCRTTSSRSHELLHTTRTRSAHEHTRPHASTLTREHARARARTRAGEAGLPLCPGAGPAGAQSGRSVGCLTLTSPAGREGQDWSPPGEGSRIPGGKLEGPVGRRSLGLAPRQVLPPSGALNAAAPGPGRVRGHPGGCGRGLRAGAVGSTWHAWESAFAHRFPLSPRPPPVSMCTVSCPSADRGPADIVPEIAHPRCPHDTFGCLETPVPHWGTPVERGCRKQGQRVRGGGHQRSWKSRQPLGNVALTPESSFIPMRFSRAGGGESKGAG